MSDVATVTTDTNTRNGEDRMSESQPLAITVLEAARRVGVSRALGYKMAREGAWPSVRVGSSIRIPVADFERWLRANTRGTVEAAAEDGA